jgi:phosphate-selective porin OprO and OprP
MLIDRVRAFAILAGLAAGAGPAAAQTAAPAQPGQPQPVAGWNDGFFVQSPDGTTRLQLGTIVQTDGRFALDDPLPITNTLVLRKARAVFGGRITRFVEFKLMPEFAGSTTILDAYFDIPFTPRFRVRSGKDKTPIGYELLVSDGALVLPERSLASQLVPNRDVGFQALGELAGGRVAYQGGVFNGNPADATSSTTDSDVNSAKDLAGRIVFLPFKLVTGSPLANLGFHLGASTGTQSGALPSYRTSIGQTFFAYATGTAADGERTRITPAVFLYAGKFGGFAEYVRSSAELLRGASRTTAANQAWDVTATYLLSGDTTSERGVRPHAPFDPTTGQWGAVQAVVRYGELTVDDDVFAAGLAAANASRSARQLTLGTNWYLNNFVKVYGSYERYSFDGGRATENSILFRTQLAF